MVGGEQFDIQEFAEFTRQYELTHTTSSPYYPASEGQTEQGMQTMNNLLKKQMIPFPCYFLIKDSQMVICKSSEQANVEEKGKQRACCMAVATTFKDPRGN